MRLAASDIHARTNWKRTRALIAIALEMRFTNRPCDVDARRPRGTPWECWVRVGWLSVGGQGGHHVMRRHGMRPARLAGARGMPGPAMARVRVLPLAIHFTIGCGASLLVGLASAWLLGAQELYCGPCWVFVLASPGGRCENCPWQPGQSWLRDGSGGAPRRQSPPQPCPRRRPAEGAPLADFCLRLVLPLKPALKGVP